MIDAVEHEHNCVPSAILSTAVKVASFHQIKAPHGSFKFSASHTIGLI